MPLRQHAFWIFWSLLGALVAEADVHYYLIIDAGSSGSRLRIYRHAEGELQAILPSRKHEEEFDTEPGLSAFVDTPSKAGASLQGMLDAARHYVPTAYQAKAHLWVKATAGMRILAPAVLRRVFNAVDAYLGNPKVNPFRFIASEVLGGEEEAVFAYLSVNHMLGKVTPSCRDCVGVLDMGGASMQIAYKPEGEILANEFSYYVRQRRQSVYAKSYIRFGTEEAILRLKRFLYFEAAHRTTIDFPCYLRGHSEVTELYGEKVTYVGTGDSYLCQNQAHMLLHTDYECMLEPCSMMGVHMSPLDGLPFYALSGFFYTVAGLGLVGWNDMKAITPAQIENATHALCRRNVTEALARSGAPWKYLKTFCFSGHYIRHILRALSFADVSTAVTFARRMPGGPPADWTQGAALFETEYMPFSLSVRSGPCDVLLDHSFHKHLSGTSRVRHFANQQGKWQQPDPLRWPTGQLEGSDYVQSRLRWVQVGGVGFMVLTLPFIAAAVLHVLRIWSGRSRWQAIPLLPDRGFTNFPLFSPNESTEAHWSPRFPIHGFSRSSLTLLRASNKPSPGEMHLKDGGQQTPHATV